MARAYTAIVRGVNNGTGIGLVEAYDLNQTVDSKLANISTRGLVQTGNNVLIGGLIVLGTGPAKVIVRPSGHPCRCPVTWPIRRSIYTTATAWPLLPQTTTGGADQETEIIGTSIPPTNDLESAIVTTLPANGAAYTAIVRGLNNGTGIGLVEIYGLTSGVAAITSPANGATVGTAFMIEATATPDSGAIASVSFYDGDTLLGTDNSSPYRFAWTGASPGTHALKAVAVHTNNQTFTSPVVNVTAVSGAGSLTRW